MKNRIFMYLFVFALLFVVFQYVNSKHILDNYEEQITKSESKVERYKDSITELNAVIKQLHAQDTMQ